MSNLRVINESREPSAIEILKRIKKLGYLPNGNKPIIVFGTTPGIVTDVTIGFGGNVVFEYRALTSEEMGN